MNVFTFIFLTVCVVMTAEVARTWMKQRHQAKPSTDEEMTATLAKIDLLEERIRVLERIVTEHKVDLKQEIDRL